MKAAQYNKYGGPEVIEINENVPKPSAGSGQILVEVHAASLNPFDWKLRAGFMKDMIPLQFPFTIGGDFSGVVVEVGPPRVGELASRLSGRQRVEAGDEVFGSALILNGGSGSFAELTTANVKNTALKPKSVNHIQVASLPLVGSSAIQALEEHIQLKPKQKILIHGGAGGIGSIAIQLAKHLRAYVVTTVSSDSVEFAKQLGADEVIDYKNEKFEDVLKDLDAVFDTVGGDTAERSFNVLKRGGIIVSMVGQPNPKLAKELGVTAIGQNTNTNSQHLIRLAELVDSGVIKAQVDKVFPLEQTKEAFDYFEKGHPQGKVVLKIT